MASERLSPLEQKLVDAMKKLSLDSPQRITNPRDAVSYTKPARFNYTRRKAHQRSGFSTLNAFANQETLERYKDTSDEFQEALPRVVSMHTEGLQALMNMPYVDFLSDTARVAELHGDGPLRAQWKEEFDPVFRHLHQTYLGRETTSHLSEASTSTQTTTEDPVPETTVLADDNPVQTSSLPPGAGSSESVVVASAVLHHEAASTNTSNQAIFSRPDLFVPRERNTLATAPPSDFARTLSIRHKRLSSRSPIPASILCLPIGPRISSVSSPSSQLNRSDAGREAPESRDGSNDNASSALPLQIQDADQSVLRHDQTGVVLELALAPEPSTSLPRAPTSRDDDHARPTSVIDDASQDAMPAEHKDASPTLDLQSNAVEQHTTELHDHVGRDNGSSYTPQPTAFAHRPSSPCYIAQALPLNMPTAIYEGSVTARDDLPLVPAAIPDNIRRPRSNEDSPARRGRGRSDDRGRAGGLTPSSDHRRSHSRSRMHHYPSHYPAHDHYNSDLRPRARKRRRASRSLSDERSHSPQGSRERSFQYPSPPAPYHDFYPGNQPEWLYRSDAERYGDGSRRALSLPRRDSFAPHSYDNRAPRENTGSHRADHEDGRPYRKECEDRRVLQQHDLDDRRWMQRRG